MGFACSVRAVKVGVQTTAPQFFGGTKPDILVSGPNVGKNVGVAVLGAGTVLVFSFFLPLNKKLLTQTRTARGAAVEGAKEGIPAVAFSGSFSTQVGYLTLDSPSASTTAAHTYAALGIKFLSALLKQPVSASSPILPPNTILNVNYPEATGACAVPDAYRFVLTRVFAPTFLSGADVATCGSARLPTEADVVKRTDACYASVSVVKASTKLDASASDQQAVLDRLGDFLLCIPSS